MPDAATIAILRDLTLLAFVAVALGVAAYKVARQVAPLARWNFSGNVLTQVYDIPDAMLAVLLALLMVQGLFGDPKDAARTEVAGSAVGDQLSVLFGQLVFSLFLIAALISYLRFIRGFNVAELFGLRNLSRGRVLTIALTAIVPTMVLIVLVNLGMSELLKNVWPDASPQDMVKTFQTTGNIEVRILMAVAAVVAAPLSEELLFRGFLYGVCKRYTDAHFAAIINGLLFAVVHMHLASFAPLFVLALVLVAVYEITGSLAVPMAIHAMFNGFMMIAMLAGAE